MALKPWFFWRVILDTISQQLYDFYKWENFISWTPGWGERRWTESRETKKPFLMCVGLGLVELFLWKRRTQKSQSWERVMKVVQRSLVAIITLSLAVAHFPTKSFAGDDTYDSYDDDQQELTEKENELKDKK